MSPSWSIQMHLVGGKGRNIQKQDNFIKEDGVVYYNKEKKEMTEVPQVFKKRALKIIIVKQSGHLSQLKSVFNPEEFIYWPNLSGHVKKLVK